MGPIDLVRTYDAREGGGDHDAVASLCTGADRPSVFLIDRLWPRGTAKASLPHDLWLATVAPSSALRKWFGHDPAKFDEFARRYLLELEESADDARPLVEAARRGRVVLLYSAKDTAHNQAVVLREWLGRL